MRVLFTALPSHGHAYPLFPLAVAAREAGHDVVFATDEDFLPTVRKAGLPAEPAGTTIHAAFAAAMGARAEGGFRLPEEEIGPIRAKVFGEDIPRRFITDLTAIFARFRPDLVVYESLNPGGMIAARAAGIPALGHTFGRLADHAQITDRTPALAAEFGLGPVAPPVFGDRFVDVCPAPAQDPVFREHPDRLPLRPVGWSDPGDLPAGILGRDPGRPLVYLTLGTVMGSPQVLRTAMAGLAALDADVLVATGPSVPRQALGEVPANVRLETWVPQSALLAHVDAMVHHGGSGSTLGAFAAGLPQLVLPQGADQFTNGAVVRELGVGDRLLDAEVTEDAVTETVRRLLADTAVRDAARALAEEVATMPSPAEVAARLPEFG